MKAASAGALALTSILALGACSSGGSTGHVERTTLTSQAPSATSSQAPAANGSAESATSVPGMQDPVGPQVSLQIAGLPFAPHTVHATGEHTSVRDVNSAGVLVDQIKPGQSVTPASGAVVLWLDSQYVLAKGELGRTATAPAGATRALVLPSDKANLIGPDSKIQEG